MITTAPFLIIVFIKKEIKAVKVKHNNKYISRINVIQSRRVKLAKLKGPNQPLVRAVVGIDRSICIHHTYALSTFSWLNSK